MYFVDRDKIEEILLYIESRICLFEEKKEWTTDIEKAALERLLQMVIESMLDVGNSIIDGFIMRDPGSYEDIIDILEDEKVITSEMSKSYKRVVSFRKNLQQSYTNVNHLELIEIFQSELMMLKRFAPNVRTYMENELGPVTAFKR
ncbi:DUF86 domain-containing protein [Bacillus sp. V3B]|uniref:type VII toxin-antitoxin system HepT family RNase toxin n=1 Tax=Bacillus sp. V3B TaxID=2804915 RepID=UPI002108AC70|nr:DUF86 domain-containing protein [Bacillus sp. V3B]MCQ6276547.1 DUF86 domain-containing protein [Bacillus sp. V3B]